MTPQHIPMTTTRVMINTIAVIFIVAMAWLLFQIRSIILLLIIGIILAGAIEPLVFRLRRQGLSRGQSILLVYVGLIALVSLGIYLLVPPLLRQVSALNEAVPSIFESLRTQTLESENSFIRRAGYRTVYNIETAYNSLRDSPNIEQEQAVGFATSVIGIIFTIISTLIVAFYWMTEKATIKRVMLGLFSFSRRDRAHAIWDEIEYKIGGWTRGQLVLMLIIGTCSGLFYYAIDLRFWLALAIWAGLTEAIPFIGPFLGGGVATVIALAESPQTALLVIGFTIVLQQLEGAVLVPRVMRNAVGMSPLTVVLAVLIGGVLIGPLGSLLAIPVGAAVQVLVQNLLRLRDDRIVFELRTADRHAIASEAQNSPFAPHDPTALVPSPPESTPSRQPMRTPAQ